MTDLREIVHQLETCSTRSMLLQALQAATSFLGFEFFSMTLRLVHIGGGAWRFLASSLPKEFLNWYDQEQILDEDPLLRGAMATVTPFYADELDAQDLARSPKATAFFRAAARYGAEGSLTGIQHDHDGAATIATFAGSSRAIPANRDEARDATREQAAWIVTHLHEALQRIVVPQVVARRGVQGPMTRLERSMLELLARGYGAREVAALLNVSGRSVRYHANRVREKFGARSLNQAVSRALECRQITLAGTALPSHWNGLPKVLLASGSDSIWSVRQPSFEMVIREVRSASSLDLLAQAARRGAGAQGFDRFAFVLRTPGTAGANQGANQLVLTNDPAVSRGPDDAGSLLRRALAFRCQARSAPMFWDEAAPGAFAVREQASESGITGALLAADGCSSVLSLGTAAAPEGDRFERRRACFRLVRELHRRACAIAPVPRPALTDADLLALRQMMGGASIRKVAIERRQKERTLRYRLAMVARKLGAQNSRHALAIATERGLVPRDMGRLLSRELVRPFVTFIAPAEPGRAPVVSRDRDSGFQPVEFPVPGATAKHQPVV